MSTPDDPPSAAKAQLRAALLKARTQRSDAQRLLAGNAFAAAAKELSGAGPSVIAGYVGVGTEPPTLPLLEALAALGASVLLPAVRPGGALDWATGQGDLVQGAFGLLEPAGPFLGPAAVAGASLMLVPALAVDSLGHRLGKGGGYYDRLLATLPRTVRLVAVVFDDELLDAVPVEAHDRSVDGVLTESGLQMFRGA